MFKVLKPSRFLNKRHAAWLRWPIGSLGYGLTLVLTREPALAREIGRRIIRQDEFHRAARRLSFYARRSWLGLNLSRDMVYVFCNQMQAEELDAMRRFLLRRAHAHPEGLIACDLAYVSAMKSLVLAAEPGRAAERDAALDMFRQDGDRVLTAIHTSPADQSDPAQEKDRETFDLPRAAEALADFAKEMRGFGQNWFVLSGTLLGIVREGGFLSHDYDIDAGIMAEAGEAEALHAAFQRSKLFRPSELEWQSIFSHGPDGPVVRRCPVFMKVAHANGVYIDIFIHYREGEVIWHASSLFRWDNSAFTLSPYMLAGTEVLGPSDADRYLTENYGNWRVPVTEFNSALDTTNQRVVRNPLSVAIFLRRMWLSARANPEGAEALRRALERDGFIQAETAKGETVWKIAAPW